MSESTRVLNTRLGVPTLVGGSLVTSSASTEIRTAAADISSTFSLNSPAVAARTSARSSAIADSTTTIDISRTSTSTFTPLVHGPGTALPTITSQHHSTSTPLISGSIVGGVVVIVSVLAVLVCLRRRSRKSKTQLVLLPNEVEEATTQEVAGHVLPYTPGHATSIPSLHVGHMSKTEKQFGQPGITADGHQIQRDSQNIPPKSSTTTVSYIPQAPINQLITTPATPPGLQNSESQSDLVLHLTAQVAAVQHQLLQMQIQKGMDYPARSPYVDAPSSYTPPTIAKSENSEDEGKRTWMSKRDSK